MRLSAGHSSAGRKPATPPPRPPASQHNGQFARDQRPGGDCHPPAPDNTIGEISFRHSASSSAIGIHRRPGGQPTSDRSSGAHPCVIPPRCGGRSPTLCDAQHTGTVYTGPGLRREPRLSAPPAACASVLPTGMARINMQADSPACRGRPAIPTCTSRPTGSGTSSSSRPEYSRCSRRLRSAPRSGCSTAALPDGPTSQMAPVNSARRAPTPGAQNRNHANGKKAHRFPFSQGRSRVVSRPAGRDGAEGGEAANRARPVMSAADDNLWSSASRPRSG